MPEAIHLYQKRAYMRARELGLTQADSSWVAEISERTGQRIDAGKHRTNRGEVSTLNRSHDPLADVWSQELEPMLQQEPRLNQRHCSSTYKRSTQTVTRRYSERFSGGCAAGKQCMVHRKQ